MTTIEIRDLERPVEELNAVQMKGIYGGWGWWNPFNWFQQELKSVSALKTVSAFRWW